MAYLPDLKAFNGRPWPEVGIHPTPDFQTVQLRRVVTKDPKESTSGTQTYRTHSRQIW
jgi:hypothetical protein